MPVAAGWPAMPQVVHQGLADHGRQRERGRVPGLAAGDGQPVALPVDVVQGQGRYLAGPQPVGHQQQQDRVIALAAGGAAVDGAQHQPHLRPGDGPRDAGQLVGRGPLHGLAQVGGQQALAMRVPQEHAQHAAAAPHRRLGQARPGALGDERAEDRRRQLRQAGRHRSGPGRPRSRPDDAGSTRSTPGAGRARRPGTRRTPAPRRRRAAHGAAGRCARNRAGPPPASARPERGPPQPPPGHAGTRPPA